jgi:4'-phosphopantetheinyl transferase
MVRVPPLGPKAVHVWWTRLDVTPKQLASLTPLLAADERMRADRFQFVRDRDRFVAGRARLRELLGGYLGVAPASICLGYGANGKPALALQEPNAASALHFNLAHAGTLAVYTFAREHALGVDVEQIRPLPDAERIAMRYFAPEEREALHVTAPEKRAAAFFRGWTRKEAYLKACGDGLRAPLDQFVVSLAVEPAAGLLSIGGDRVEAAHWRLASWEPAPGYVAALTLRCRACRLVPCGEVR